MTEIELLLSKIDKFPYPDTMKIVRGEIKGRAFFPGGRGLFDNADNAISNKQIMILGQDFDCETNHEISLRTGEENIIKSPTWRNMLELLELVDISPNNCFFTNAILGIRVGDKSTGKSPAFKNAQFIERCREFFLEQIAIQKPKAILVLGKETAQFLASMNNQLNCWISIKNFTTIDRENNQVKTNISFNNGVISNVVLLTHPSFRPSNIHRRKFNNFEKGKAEIEMIKSIINS